MKTRILTIVLSFIALHCSSQTHWLMTETTGNGKSTLIDKMSTNNSEILGDLHLINYNSSFQFRGQVPIDLSLKDMSKCNIFTVFKPSKFQKEELVWKISSSKKDQLLFTNQRVADLHQGKFMNFDGKNLKDTQINCYQHFRNTFEANFMELNTRASNPQVPVDKFKGSLAELIIFNQKLAPIAQQIIQSNLAIKYSIPLSYGSDYLDEKGDKLWSFDKNKDYSHNIAGLGRNQELHLHQKQSQSKLGEGYIAFGLEEIQPTNKQNPHNLANHEYLLWGDDSQPLTYNKIQDDVFQLQRSWKINTDRFKNQIPLSVLMSHKGMSQALKEEQSLWLYLSSTTLDKHSIESSQAYALAQAEDIFSATGIHIQNKSFFTLLKAPSLWIETAAKGPKCDSDRKGSLGFKVHGGKAPYTVTLNTEKNALVDETHIFDSGMYSFEKLDAEIYRLSVLDNIGNQYSTMLSINSEGISGVDLPKKIVLKKGQSYYIDAYREDLGEFKYEWTLPNLSKINDSNLNINHPGQYSLHVSDEECQAWYSIEVIQEANNIHSMKLNPNPTIDGHFNLSATLREATPYSIQISTIEGRLLSEQEFDAQQYIFYQGKLQNRGMYYITLISGNSKRTEKLVFIQ